MSLIPQDKCYLDEHGIHYDIHEADDCTYLVLKDFAISTVYDQTHVDVLIKIRKGYPVTPLDMFWIQPAVKFKNTGKYPDQADCFEPNLGSNWQRFSRHYEWNPTFTLANHLLVVKQELVAKE